MLFLYAAREYNGKDFLGGGIKGYRGQGSPPRKPDQDLIKRFPLSIAEGTYNDSPPGFLTCYGSVTCKSSHLSPFQMGVFMVIKLSLFCHWSMFMWAWVEGWKPQKTYISYLLISGSTKPHLAICRNFHASS